LLISVKQSRKKYELYLEKERTEKKSTQEEAKRKSTLEEIEEINDSAVQLLQKAENEGDLRHLAKANSSWRTAKHKKKELAQVDISLNEKLKKLKE